MSNQVPFRQAMTNLLTGTLKKFVPVFWIPVLGDKWLDQIAKSRFMTMLCSAWTMLSLM